MQSLRMSRVDKKQFNRNNIGKKKSRQKWKINFQLIVIWKCTRCYQWQNSKFSVSRKSKGTIWISLAHEFDKTSCLKSAISLCVSEKCVCVCVCAHKMQKCIQFDNDLLTSHPFANWFMKIAERIECLLVNWNLW